MTKRQSLEHYIYEEDVSAFFLKHAAKLIGRHPRTIKRWIKKGKISGWKLPEGDWYIDLDEINKHRKMRRKSILDSDGAIAILQRMYDK